MTLKLLIACILTYPMFALDAAGEAEKVMKAMELTWKTGDAEGYRNLLTNNYWGTGRNGTVQDLAKTMDNFKNGPKPPADLKREVVRTSGYGDTIIQLAKESWTSPQSGAKTTAYINLVFVKESGVWKLAMRSSTTIPPAN